jgi:hypothetical protein
VPDPSPDSMSFQLLHMLLQEDMDGAGDQDAAGAASSSSSSSSSSRFARMRAKTHTAEVSLSEEMSKVAASEEKRGGCRAGQFVTQCVCVCQCVSVCVSMWSA